MSNLNWLVTVHWLEIAGVIFLAHVIGVLTGWLIGAGGSAEEISTLSRDNSDQQDLISSLLREKRLLEAEVTSLERLAKDNRWTVTNLERGSK